MTEPTPTEENKSFTPITSQADLDTIIGNQLAQELAKYSDYETLKTKAAKLDELEEANKSELEKLQALAPLLAQAEPQLPKTVIRSEGTGDLPLNGDAIENSLKAALDAAGSESPCLSRILGRFGQGLAVG